MSYNIAKSETQSQRPRSAVESARFQAQSIGKYMTQQTSTLDEKTVTSIWNGLGQYIAKQMRNGKGVSIPKFGNFTFSAPNVDLAGTTNPQERDNQIRVPVFLVGKDFVSAVTLKAGVAHNGAQLRPYDLKGASGIIPKVKINYTEVATYCCQNKDSSRNGCEQVFRFLSDKVRKGETVQMEIPFVGTFLVKSNIAAVVFLDNLAEETKGTTAKNHYVNKLFASSNNKLNLQIHDQNQAKQNPSLGMGGAMRLTGDAESWLKSNLNINVQDLLNRQQNPNKNQFDRESNRGYQRIQSAKQIGGSQLHRYGSAQKQEDFKRKSWALQQNNGQLTEQNKIMFDRMSDTKSVSKRPMSAVTRSSRMTNVPELGRMKLMLIATDIFKNRSQITEQLTQAKQSLRNTQSSSEIQSLLKKLGINVDIGNIKALLRELGFNWNGPACSFYDLFQGCKVFLYGQSEQEENTKTYFQSLTSPKQFDSISVIESGSYNLNNRPNGEKKQQKSGSQLLQMIKDLFYASGKSIYELYSQARLGNNIDYEGLKKIVNYCSSVAIRDQDIQQVFNHIAKNKDSLSYQEFERAFKWDVPVIDGQWETLAIRRIRDWMIKNNLSSETAFELFLKKTNNIIKRKLGRIEFHKAINSESELGVKFSAPEIDALFNVLDANKDNELDIDEWRIKIYEDINNPLQMLREIVGSNKLTPDDLIFKMHLRYWDAPLDFPALCEALRRLDPTLSEIQIRFMAKTLKNKENKVEITTLLRNLCGMEHETVDYRNKMFRQIYAEIHPHKQEQLMQMLEEADPLNDGRVEPQGLKACLRKLLKSIDEESIDRFVRFLDKDKSGKINYMEFLGRMGEVSNRDHNPFKSVVQRLAYFLETNKQSVQSLLKRLNQRAIEQGESSPNGVSVLIFAQFLKSKIDKKRDMDSLKNYAYFIDIDKDGYISEIDLTTCLANLKSETFFKNSGEALSQSAFASAKKFFPNKNNLPEDRAIEIARQIRTALINKRIAYKEAFNRFDQNKDGFLNFTEFSQGLDTIITLSAPVKEKLFSLMDKNEIGLVDYPNFLQIIQLTTAYKSNKGSYEDNFDWENNTIDQIKQWIQTSKITVEEAFKSFDRDFDGTINKEDLKWALVNIIQVKPEEIFPTKLDRLFKIMDFYKTNKIQLSDFQRLMSNENPYATTYSRATPSTENFRKSFGGGFVQQSAHDWKVSVIQQMGLVISKNFSSLKESFEIASQYMQKITYDQFKAFIDKYNALSGFNLTGNLIQKIFSEIDPHKKGYLTESDWNNAFQSFNWNDQIFIELKNTLQCQFSDCDSAFEFLLTFKNNQQGGIKTLNYAEFEKAINSLTNERFKKGEISSLWKFLTDQGKVTVIDKYQFRSHFDNLRYTGNSTVRTLKSAPPGARTTIYTQSSSSSTWNVDIFEKLRQIIKSSSKSFEEIFKDFDTDQNGSISQVEFRNALRKLNLGLSSREIDQLMVKIDTNGDGKIDWKEFVGKFKTSELDDRLKERAKDKMGRLKELMILHMTSPNDAFRFFDESKLGKLTYQEFSKLVIKANDLAGDKVPTYPVIKDLFDTIDIRKDGIIDINEWQQTFGNVVEGSQKMSMKATPLTMWENSREFQQIGTAIARNRKTLKDLVDKEVSQNNNGVNFSQVKRIMTDLINQHFKGLSDDKLKCVLRVGEIQGSAASNGEPLYDFTKMLDIYRSRHAGPQM